MYVPIKRIFLKVNYAPYATETLKEAIVKVFEFENQYIKNKARQNLKYSIKQINFC